MIYLKYALEVIGFLLTAGGATLALLMAVCGFIDGMRQRNPRD